MAFYQITYKQKLPASLDEVWDFISTPANLKKITPGYMGFDITSGGRLEKMYPGMIISYKVSPIFGIKMVWVTEITQMHKKEYFVDEQRSGHYAMWHHQHKIEEIEGGVLMTDIVSYKPPLGFLGAIANSLLIRKQLDEIFEFRRKAMNKQFGEMASVDFLRENVADKGLAASAKYPESVVCLKDGTNQTNK
ncbi:MAG: SRPBCC family protein [Bacteroidales bacterium]|nr:SRPBCC family protein [Bacteroidales bacterium]MCF8344206.1 SRPBCC family protein [Bacteroidales bacterium]MCF8352691.1 SRPBCC family protein [Bacteroidales bacterium]MCF8375077.1 SRPBCC family protein [Bacteroidales bacterium]MCF8399983.1 SRPBCC family protein [Bacteroidales bacterium]